MLAKYTVQYKMFQTPGLIILGSSHLKQLNFIIKANIKKGLGVQMNVKISPIITHLNTQRFF